MSYFKLKLKQFINKQNFKRLCVLFLCTSTLTGCSNEGETDLGSGATTTTVTTTTVTTTSTTTTIIQGTIRVIGIEDDTTPTSTKELSWSCNSPPCTFRFIINQDKEYTFPSTHEYESTSTITKSTDDPNTEEGTYYLHIQAKDSNNNESEVKTISFILRNPTILTLVNPTPQTEVLPFYENRTPTIQISGKGIESGREVQLYSSSDCNTSNALSNSITVPESTSSVEIKVNYLHPGAYNIHVGTKANQNDSVQCSTESLSYILYNPIAAGFELSCYLSNAGLVKCWGEGKNGQLGYQVQGNTTAIGDEPGEMGSSLSAVNLGTNRTAKLIAIGDNPTGDEPDNHVCAILDDNNIKCWGGNDYGQLGLGHTDARGNNPATMGDNLPAIDLGANRKAKVISNGEHYTCAILDNSKMKCWGKNDKGQLGLSHTENRGDKASQMGDHLPYVDLGTNKTVKAIATGKKHVCAILDDNKVKCWGENHKGQLGLSDTNDRGDKANQMGDNLPYVDLGTNKTAKAIVASHSHTCAILDDNKVKCWGENHKGQLGLSDTNDRGGNANEMGDNLPFVDLGNDTSGTKYIAKSIAANSFYTCIILSNDNSIRCWGENHKGQLGLGHIENHGDNANEMGDSLQAVDLGNDTSGTKHTAKTIATGGAQSCTILNDDRLKCWGYNNKGQLGLGDTNNRADNPDDPNTPANENEIGDDLPYVDLGL